MLKIILFGSGKMGKEVLKAIGNTDDIECAGVITSNKEDLPGAPPRYSRPDQLRLSNECKYVIIDFSRTEALDMIGNLAQEHAIPVVLATTGYDETQVEYIKSLSRVVPVVYSANYSIGITVMMNMLKQATEALSADFDIEIIEKHHNRKFDAPSGTALMLAEVMDPKERYEKKFGRYGKAKRQKEMGIHAVRGGTIAGEHTVMFAGENEVLEITHRASSAKIFADGAIQAARFVARQQPGLYGMSDVISKV
jgi:4-hydroxy-tetrahydrodipicolinate reductase